MCENRITIKAAGMATGLLKDVVTRRVIPQVGTTMQVDMAATGCKPAPVERNRSEAALRGVRDLRYQSRGQRWIEALEINECRGLRQRQATVFHPQRLTIGLRSPFDDFAACLAVFQFDLGSRDVIRLSSGAIPGNDLEADQKIVEAIGPEFVDAFLAVKRAEWGRYATHTTDWELKEYLDFL